VKRHRIHADRRAINVFPLCMRGCAKKALACVLFYRR
jgi:hypothetical protein